MRSMSDQTTSYPEIPPPDGEWWETCEETSFEHFWCGKDTFGRIEVIYAYADYADADPKQSKWVVAFNCEHCIGPVKHATWEEEIAQWGRTLGGWRPVEPMDDSRIARAKARGRTVIGHTSPLCTAEMCAPNCHELE